MKVKPTEDATRLLKPWRPYNFRVLVDLGKLILSITDNSTFYPQMAHLEVVVPPEIVDNATSGETTVEEGNSVTLTCKARGFPVPVVSWKREENAKIVLRDQGNKKGQWECVTAEGRESSRVLDTVSTILVCPTSPVKKTVKWTAKQVKTELLVLG